MKCKKIAEILLPFRKGVSLNPFVSPSDKISYAIELMLDNNLKEIAVLRNNRPIGMVNLKDALMVLGLNVSTKINNGP